MRHIRRVWLPGGGSGEVGMMSVRRSLFVCRNLEQATYQRSPLRQALFAYALSGDRFRRNPWRVFQITTSVRPSVPHRHMCEFETSGWRPRAHWPVGAGTKHPGGAPANRNGAAGVVGRPEGRPLRSDTEGRPLRSDAEATIGRRGRSLDRPTRSRPRTLRNCP
jgi:hypothetical protein